jgi:hypothetical protein
MAIKIKADTLQALDDWKAGKPVRSLELGHVHRMQEHPGFGPRIDMSQRIDRDQERAHAYCFHLIELFSLNGVPETHEAFLEACDAYEETFEWGELPIDQKNVFNAEREAAESLAWKALLLGWRKAVAGHDAGQYIEVSRGVVSAT